MRKKIVEVPFPKCPRCDGFIPNDKHAGEYMGAISRLDNETEICSKCGEVEALEDLVYGKIYNWKGKP